MSVQLNANEIFLMAEKIERNGANFYRQAARRLDDPVKGAMLEELARMEDGHETVFRDLRLQPPVKGRDAGLLDPGDEALSYLEAWADGYVFNLHDDPSARLSGGESLAEILKIAIGLEKDSIVFYLGMQDLVPEHSGKSRIGVIINEEMRHIANLNNELKLLKN